MMLSNQSRLSVPPSEPEGKHTEPHNRASHYISGVTLLNFHNPRQFRYIPPPATIFRNRFWIITGGKSVCQIRTPDFFRSICKYNFFFSIYKCQ